LASGQSPSAQTFHGRMEPPPFGQELFLLHQRSVTHDTENEEADEIEYDKYCRQSKCPILYLV
jgi:hypothetical protein